MDTTMTQYYGVRVSTILNAIDKFNSELDYLCALVEQADPEFYITNAVAYSHAVIAISNQLDFLVENISESELNEDEDHLRLTKEQIVMLNDYTENSEEAIMALEKTCGISLQNN